MHDSKATISYTAELWRKLIHVVAILAPLLMFEVGKWWSVGLLLPCVALAITTDVLRARFQPVTLWVEHTFGFMMRRAEMPRLGNAIVFNGATWVLISFLLLVLVFPVRIAATILIACMLSDATAAIIGRRYGKHPWKNSHRSIEGSVAFFVTGLLVVAVMGTTVFWVGALSVVAATLAEIPDSPLNDNLRVPAVAASVLFLLEILFLDMEMHLFSLS